MMHRRLHRLTTTFFVVLSLLFSQLALARYICPQQAVVETAAVMTASGMPCDGMDQEQPALCREQATAQDKTFEALKLPVVPLPAIIQVLGMSLVMQAQEAQAVPPTASSEVHPPPDPLFLSTLRLRV